MSEPDAPLQGLTRRQRQVLEQAALGLSNRQIGAVLEIAEQTVKNHLLIAMRKMSLHDRTHAVVIAIGHGWINVPIEDPQSTTDGSMSRRDASAEG